MKGSTKQIEWANQIQKRYQAARGVIEAKASALPEDNKVAIMTAVSKIDRHILENEDAGDIIARGGSSYLDSDDLNITTKAIMDAIRSIASGQETVLTA